MVVSDVGVLATLLGTCTAPRSAPSLLPGSTGPVSTT
jgi:hypothetical protein